MKSTRFAFFIILIILSLNVLFAQDIIEPEIEYYEVETINGNIYSGEILEMNDKYLIIQIEDSETISIKRKYIKTIEKLNFEVTEEKIVVEKKDFLTKYFIGENAYAIGKGNYYYTNTMILLNEIHYGLNNHLTFSGSIYLFGITGNSSTPLNFSLHYSRPIFSENINIAGGIKYSRLLGGKNSDSDLLMVYGIATIGNHSTNLSFSYYNTIYDSNNRYSKSFESLVNVGGKLKISNSTSLMIDIILFGKRRNHVFNRNEIYAMIGARSRIKNIYLDYGIISITDSRGIEFDENILPMFSVKFPISSLKK